MNRALLVGINKYPGSPLNGCLNDINDMANHLVAACGFKIDEVRLLADERATTDAIRERLFWLVDGVKSGDRLFFHFSGHGAQMPIRNDSGEIDGLDEVICPVDFDWTDQHVIRDDDFYNIFCNVPEGVQFTWVSDSCNSGNLTRLIAEPERVIKTLLPPVDIDWRLRTAEVKGIKKTKLGEGLSKGAVNFILVSGCKSDQTSADAIFNDRYNGALTYYLLKQLKQSGTADSITKIVKDVNTALLKERFSQQPQLEGNGTLMKLPFLKHVKKQFKPSIRAVRGGESVQYAFEYSIEGTIDFERGFLNGTIISPQTHKTVGIVDVATPLNVRIVVTGDNGTDFKLKYKMTKGDKVTEKTEEHQVESRRYAEVNLIF